MMRSTSSKQAHIELISMMIDAKNCVVLADVVSTKSKAE
jgi:hypothetical protein